MLIWERRTHHNRPQVLIDTAPFMIVFEDNPCEDFG